MALHRPELQTLPREQLRALQTERLQSLVRRVFERPIPFFRARLSEAGIVPDDIKTLGDLPRIPRTNKDDLRASEAAHPPLGDYRGALLSDCIRLSTSTGTTGRPTIAVFTRHDLEVEYDAAGRSFARQGYRPGEIITHAHPGGLNGGAALLGGAVEAFGALNVPVGPPASVADAERAVRLWQEIRPDRYEMFGPALHTFWEAARSLGVDPVELGMPEPADLPPHRTVSAGLECFAFLGSACEQHNGAHVAEDEAIVEAVDPASGEPVPSGQRGSLVVTTLTKDNAMLRYDLEDLVRLDPSPCPCGETTVRAFWDGRIKDVVPVAGKALLPMDVQMLLAPIEEVARPALEFQMVRASGATALTIRVEAPSPSPALEQRVRTVLAGGLGVPVEVTLLEAGALPRPAYKPLRVVDE
ncbi:MAG TPA: hypothetical protein VGB52_12860 [Actinomycetota bacterium]